MPPPPHTQVLVGLAGVGALNCHPQKTTRRQPRQSQAVLNRRKHRRTDAHAIPIAHLFRTCTRHLRTESYVGGVQGPQFSLTKISVGKPSVTSPRNENRLMVCPLLEGAPCASPLQCPQQAYRVYNTVTSTYTRPRTRCPQTIHGYADLHRCNRTCACHIRRDAPQRGQSMHQMQSADLLVLFVHMLPERRRAVRQFVQEGPKTEDIHHLVVFGAAEQFWGGEPGSAEIPSSDRLRNLQRATRAKSRL